MQRAGLVIAAAALVVACNDVGGPRGQPRVVVYPLLDTVFVGDSTVAHQITYYDANGAVQNPGTILWSSSDPTILTVDAATGTATGLKAGTALVIATAKGVQGSSLGVVSPNFQLTVLLDSLFVMPNDTISVPVQVDHKAAGTPTVWFRAASNAVFAIDSSTGIVTAIAAGGPLPFVAFAALGPDTAADSGTVEVVSLSDTTGGKAYYTMFGTLTRGVKVAARGLNYRRSDDTLTFRLSNALSQLGTVVEAVILTSKVALMAPTTIVIDSISPTELFTGGSDASCRPVRNWGLWSVLTNFGELDALSRPGGSITVTQIVPVTGGQAISGRFAFQGQRYDFYNDPGGQLTIRGSFVAPLITNANTCR